MKWKKKGAVFAIAIAVMLLMATTMVLSSTEPQAEEMNLMPSEPQAASVRNLSEERTEVVSLTPSYNPKAPAEVALFEDNYPWGSMAIENILSANAISYDVYTSAQMGSVGLSPYKKVITASVQGDTFWNALEANKAWFESYVSGGGMLEMHLCAYSGSNSPGKVYPGGFVFYHTDIEDISIVDQDHSVLNTPNTITDGELDGWGYSAHGWFDAIPVGGNIVLKSTTNDEPVWVETTFDRGCIFATTQTVEWRADAGYPQFLENMLLHDTCPCTAEYAVYQAGVSDPEGILNPLRELRDSYLKAEYVDRYYDYSTELTMVMTKDPALAYEAAQLLVKYSPMIEQQVTGTGKVKLITGRDVEEVVSFTNRLKSDVRKNSGKIDHMRSQEIIKFLDEFKEQVEASEGKTFSEALQDSIYYMGNIDTTPDGNNESGIASIDTTVKVPEPSSSSGITRP